jgi:Yip1 domain.
MTSPENQSGAGSTSVTTATPSIWEDFVDIFTSPSEVFARRQNGNFWLPMILVTVIIGVIFLATKGLMQPIMDAEFQRGAAAAMRKNPQLTEDQMATMRHYGELASGFLVFILIPIGVFLTGLALWLIGKLFDATETLHTALVVTAYSFIPRIVDSIIRAVQAAVMSPASLNGQYSVALSPARFMNPDTASPLMLALAGRLDVFTIWVTVLLAIGLSVTGKIPRSRAAIAAACVWLLGAFPALLTALRS